MYNPASFVERRPEVLAQAISEYPLATIITASASGRIEASAIPMLLQTRGDDAAILRGHMAKANPQWSPGVEAVEALAIFAGPQHYISPSWYPSKQEHGRVVPTWNYLIVHVRGTLTFFEDPESLLEVVSALTESQEANRPVPWKVQDAPEDFIASQLRAIVGLELEIRELEGKWKLSQNRPLADRLGVAAGLERTSNPVAARMAKLVRDRLGR